MEMPLKGLIRGAKARGRACENGHHSYASHHKGISIRENIKYGTAM